MAASLLVSCSLLNREGPDVTCDDLLGGAISACEQSVIARCLDGETVTYEVCDEELVPGEDVCSASWQDPKNHRCSDAEEPPNLGCGNGTKATNEACDDANLDDGDGCDSNCTATACGNGVTSSGEGCDDGNVADGDGCDSNCQPTGCGNGLVAGDETCDDGNVEDGDGCDSNCTETACGNGLQTAGETCDDGNLEDGDGCDANCVPTACGNGLVAGDEACDDGNLDEGDACDPNCRPPSCGNGYKSAIEACDDGNLENGDGCDANCAQTACGNGVVAGDEVCDDGNVADDDGCDSNCTPTGCGNGVKARGEGCDDGNLVDGDGCDSNCVPTGCGNGIVSGNEGCDDGNLVESDGCDPNCMPTGCGNGFKSTTEGCDDGNLTNGDGCDANCTVTACGNGIKAGTEQCDDGNLVENDGCDPNCKPTGCGNGFKSTTEGCDDGNLTSGDGCDANCTFTACGNGVKAGTEQCDDGNLTSGDGCDANCTTTGCGNGVLTAGEQCDNGGGNSATAVCSSACTPNGILKVAEGADHTCALVTGGKVRCWGSGMYGQLGYGNTSNLTVSSYAAGYVAIGGTATDVVAGEHFSCALLQTGDVRCWGRGANGRLGLGNTLNIGDDETPDSAAIVSLGGPVQSISTSSTANFACALLTSGGVRCWGSGSSGRLGYGNTNNIGDDELPSSVGPVSLGGNAVQVSSSGSSFLAHSCAVLTTGAVRCWGYELYGNLGYGSTANIGDNELPSSVGPVSLNGSALEVVTGGSDYYRHSCARLSGGSVRCWGYGGAGALGLGNTTSIGDNELPSSVGPLSLSGAASKLAALRAGVCARLTDGRVQCWGDGSSGRTGYGSSDNIGDNELPSSVGTVPLNATTTNLWAGKDGPFVQIDGKHVKVFKSDNTPQYPAYEAFLEALQYPAAVLAASATKVAAEQEDNSTQASATALFTPAVDLGWGGSIAAVADQDYFKIVVPAGKSLRLRTSALFDASSCPGNTLVRLYAPNGTALGFDDDDGLPGGCSLINPAVDTFASNLPAGTYYVRVEESGNDATIGRYQLLVEVL
jgi:cysteine-rich repeat protein